MLAGVDDAADRVGQAAGDEQPHDCWAPGVPELRQEPQRHPPQDDVQQGRQPVELKIVETPPNFKGDTQGGKKPATLESGAVVQIPFHVLEGEVIRVDTVRGEYIERANK